MPRKSNRPRRRTNRLRGVRSGRSVGNENTRVSFSRQIPPPLGLADSLSAVPQEFKTTLTWAGIETPQSVAAGAFADAFIIRLNSPYDPNDAFGGASATGYAKLIAMYGKCFVRGIRMNARFLSVSATTGGAAIASVVFGVTINTNNTALTTVPAAVGNGLTTYDLIGQSPDNAHFQRTLDIGRFLDVPDILSNTSLFSTSAANPSNIVYAHCWVQNMVGSTSAYYNIVVDVEFECTFTDPIPFT